MTLGAAIDLLDGALAYARAHGIRELMANASILTGFESPTLRERYFLAEKWARTAGGTVRLALVVRAEMIDPHKFGVTVAVNRGMNADVFSAEAAALDWLDRYDQPLSPGVR